MAQRNFPARLALAIGILVVAAGIYMLWWHTRSLVQRDAHKGDRTMLHSPVSPTFPFPVPTHVAGRG